MKPTPGVFVCATCGAWAVSPNGEGIVHTCPGPRLCGDGNRCPLDPVCDQGCRSDDFLAATKTAPHPLVDQCPHASKCRLVTVPECMTWLEGNPTKETDALPTTAPPSTTAQPLSRKIVLRCDVCSGDTLEATAPDNGPRVRLRSVESDGKPTDGTWLTRQDAAALGTWLLGASEMLERADSSGTTTPVRSVPSEQWGSLALNFCTPHTMAHWRRCAGRQERRGSVEQMHPCPFATLKI